MSILCKNNNKNKKGGRDKLKNLKVGLSKRIKKHEKMVACTAVQY